MLLFGTAFYISGLTIKATLFAVFFTYVAYLGKQPTNWDGVIILVQGCCYLLAGVSVWQQHPRQAVYGVLSLLWLFLGLFSLGYAMGGWLAVDPMWTSILCIAGFGLIGVMHDAHHRPAY